MFTVDLVPIFSFHFTLLPDSSTDNEITRIVAMFDTDSGSIAYLAPQHSSLSPARMPEISTLGSKQISIPCLWYTTFHRAFDVTKK